MQIKHKAMRLGLFLSITLTGFAVAGAVEVSCSPGSLGAQLRGQSGVDGLVVSGKIDASDLFFIADSLPSLRSLDLSSASIAAYDGEPLHGHIQYPAATVPAGCFMGAPLENVVFPAETTTLADGAFAGSRLRSVVLDTHTRATGFGVFASCIQLCEADFAEGAAGDYAFAGCVALEKATVGGGTLAAGVFSGCSALERIHGGGNITSVGGRAFEGCGALESFDFGAGLRTVGESAFAGSGLRAADMGLCPTDISIGGWAFAGCPSLESVMVPSGAVLGEGAFFGCTALENAEVPSGAGAVPDYAFAGAPLRNGSGVIPDGIVHIGAYALRGATGMRTVKLPASLISVGDYAMENMDGLASIDAVALDAVPATGTEVWRGVEQGAVELYTTTQTSTLFAGAPQWSDFKITVESGATSPEAVAPERLKAWFEGDVLVLSSQVDEIAGVRVFNAAGMLLADVEPASSTVRIFTTNTPGALFIVNATMAGSGTETIKITR